ncbi:podocin isoform X1 [Poecilia latipinna]|uniref:podocin isoform X1 n=1 Tax=Poecilia latipinna TaxID=48699 RepID=UPI00072E2032|nr:PREDICTED: podocin isoform X1 [Poecilia latipinna]
MEKPPTVKPNHRSRTMPRKKEGESGAPVRERRHHQKLPKAGHHAGSPSVKKEKREMEKSETNQEKVDVEKEAEVKLKSTVVDIDSVRENKVQEENLWLLEAAEQDGLKRKSLGVFEWLLMVFALSLVLLFLPISIWFCVKVVREHERAVIFRLGHLLRGKPKGPGLLFYLPLLDVCHKVDIRLRMLKVPSHMVVTKDLARPELSAVCYYQIENVALCSAALSNLTSVLQSLVQAAIRDVFAQHTFSHILQYRRRIGEQIQKTLDSVTCRWGVKVERTDIEELSFPVELQQSLAADAEAKRQQQFTQVKASERETAAWEGFRASFRHLQPALVLPLAPDLLNMNSDLASLPPPPPLSEDGGDVMAASERDSPMM